MSILNFSTKTAVLVSILFLSLVLVFSPKDSAFGQACFSGASWQGPTANPVSANRTKPIYTYCTGQQVINSNLDITSSETAEPAVKITHDASTDAGLQILLSSGAMAGYLTRASQTLLGSGSSGTTLRVQDIVNNPEIQLQHSASSPADHWSLYVNQSDGSLRFWGANSFTGADRLTILTNSGNVGIGTTTQSERLTIDGNLELPHGRSVKVNNGGATGTLYLGNYADGLGFNWTGIGRAASLIVEGDVNAGSLCIRDSCRSTWGAVGGTSGWTDDGATVRLTTQADWVGIGTTIPQAQLEVRDNTAGTGKIRITDIAQSPELELWFDDVSSGHWRLYANQADDSLRIWGANPLTGTDRLAITQAGNVGIGTTLPTAKLEVSGDSSSTRFCLGGSCISSWPSAGSTYWSPSGNDIYNANTGNVGIGIPSPSSKLDVGGNVEINGMLLLTSAGNDVAKLINGTTEPLTFLDPDGKGFRFWDNTGPPTGAYLQAGNGRGSSVNGLIVGQSSQTIQSGQNLIYGVMEASSAGNLLYLQKNTVSNAKFTVDSIGRVGIGTDTPSKPLHIYAGDSGTSYTGSANLVVEDSGVNTVDINAPDGLLAGFKVNVGQTNTAYFQYEDRGGSNPTNQLQIGAGHGSGEINFIAGGTDPVGNSKMIIKNSGNVGIGAIAPQTTLEVNGQAIFGSDSEVVASGQNLIYGNVDQSSQGNLLLLQNESNTVFRIGINDAYIDLGTIQIDSANYIGLQTNGLRIKKDTIEHFEEKKSGGIETAYTYGSCNCGGISQAPEIPQNRKLADKFNNFLFLADAIFFIPIAHAAPQCFASQTVCQSFPSCDYCDTAGDLCPDPPATKPWECTYQCTASTSESNAPLCDSLGSDWVENTSLQITAICNGTSGSTAPYVSRRTCERDTSSNVFDYFTKIEFAGSPAQGELPQVIIKNDLSAPDNALENCGWMDLTGDGILSPDDGICPNGEILVGYNESRAGGIPDKDLWRCCEL